MITVKEIFSTNLRNIRKEFGLTQENFAEKICIQPRNYVDIENGKHLPTPQNIDKICNKLNIPVTRLFTIPDEIIENEKLKKINQIKESLMIMNCEQVNIVQNIVNYAFRK